MELDHASKYLSELGNPAGWRCNQRARRIGRICSTQEATVYVVYISVSFGSINIRGFIPSIDWIILSRPISDSFSNINETP